MPNAGKYRLRHSQPDDRPRKAPRSSAPFVRLYLRKQGLLEREVWRLNRRNGRSAAIFRVARDRLRPLTPAVPTAAGIRVDRLLADAAHRWAIATCRSPDSWMKYLDVLARWLAFARPGRRRRLTLERQVETVAADVLAWLQQLEDLGCGVRTIVLYRDIVRSWFRWLWDAHLIDRLPITREIIRSYRVRRERIQRGDGTRQALTKADAQLIAEWAFRRAKPVQALAVLLETSAALRSVECERLDLRQLSLVTPAGGDESATIARLVVCGKGERQRVVILEPVVLAAWRRYAHAERRRGTRGPLLRKPGGGRYSRRTVQAWAKKALCHAGRPDLSSHDLRRTAATLLREDGADITQVQGVLGHASLETTRTSYITREKPLTARTGVEIPA